MTRDALCSYYTTRNVIPQFPPLFVTLHDCGRHGPLRRGRGNSGVHCGLHSDYIMSRESFLANSAIDSARIMSLPVKPSIYNDDDKETLAYLYLL